MEFLSAKLSNMVCRKRDAEFKQLWSQRFNYLNTKFVRWNAPILLHVQFVCMDKICSTHYI